MRLIDAPVGLFEHNGNLALKTEYSTIHKDGTSTPDCYLVESGEYFWGGAKTAAERNDLEVKPVRQNCGNCDWYAESCGTCYNPNMVTYLNHVKRRDWCTEWAGDYEDDYCSYGERKDDNT